MKKLFLSAAFLAGGVLFCNAQVSKKENGEKPVAKVDTVKSANPMKAEEVKQFPMGGEAKENPAGETAKVGQQPMDKPKESGEMKQEAKVKVE